MITFPLLEASSREVWALEHKRFLGYICHDGNRSGEATNSNSTYQSSSYYRYTYCPSSTEDSMTDQHTPPPLDGPSRIPPTRHPHTDQNDAHPVPPQQNGPENSANSHDTSTQVSRYSGVEQFVYYVAPVLIWLWTTVTIIVLCIYTFQKPQNIPKAFTIATSVMFGTTIVPSLLGLILLEYRRPCACGGADIESTAGSTSSEGEWDRRLRFPFRFVKSMMLARGRSRRRGNTTAQQAFGTTPQQSNNASGTLPQNPSPMKDRTPPRSDNPAVLPLVRPGNASRSYATGKAAASAWPANKWYQLEGLLCEAEIASLSLATEVYVKQKLLVEYCYCVMWMERTRSIPKRQVRQTETCRAST